METSKVAIGRPSKYTKLLIGLRSYLTDARADPSLPLTIVAISRSIGVMKSTIYQYQHDPQIAEQLGSIRTLATARKRAFNIDDLCGAEVDDADISNTAPTEDLKVVATQTISLDILAIRASAAVQKSIWSMNRFLGRHRKHRHVSDLPRVVYDLDITLAELHQIRREISALSDDWRQSAQTESSNDDDVRGQLSLSSVAEKQF